MVTSYKLSYHTAAILGGWKILVPGKILEGATTFRWVTYIQRLRSVWCPGREGIKNWERQKQKCNLGLCALFTGVHNYRLSAELSYYSAQGCFGFACLLPWLSNALPATIFVWFVPGRKIVLPLSQEAPSIWKIRLAIMTSATLKLPAF